MFTNHGKNLNITYFFDEETGETRTVDCVTNSITARNGMIEWIFDALSAANTFPIVSGHGASGPSLVQTAQLVAAPRVIHRSKTHGNSVR